MPYIIYEFIVLYFVYTVYCIVFRMCFSRQGFAFINFHRREDAARAIAGVSGFGYGHLILNVEWAK